MNKTRLHGLGGRFRGQSGPETPGNQTWRRQRGTTQYHGQFDVIGNFPGYQTWAALIVNARVEITSHYLLVDEYAAHGFGIALNDIIEYSVDRDEQSFGDIVVHFRPANRSLIFRLRPSRGRIPLPTRTNPTVLAAALADNGLAASEFAQTLAGTLAVTWENSNALEEDDAVWEGSVTAPLRPGMESAPAKAWLTKNALIWGSPRGSGLNRLPAGAITGLTKSQLVDARETPLAWIHTDLIAGVDLALPIIFNQVAGPQARIDRDAFVSVFHPELVRDEELITGAPWDIPDDEPETDTPVSPEETITGSDGDEESTAQTDDAPEDESGEDAVAAEPDFSAWDDLAKPSTLGGLGTGVTLRQLDEEEPPLYGIDPGGTRLVDALAAWPKIQPDEPEPEPSLPAITEPDKLLTYLARSRQAITEVNENIDRRLAGNAAFTLRAMPPSSSEQAVALLELIELGSSGYYSAEQVSKIKAEIAGLGEASVRLRSLLELCNAGHMTIAEAGAKRDRIMGSIAMLMETG